MAETALFAGCHAKIPRSVSDRQSANAAAAHSKVPESVGLEGVLGLAKEGVEGLADG